MSKVTLEVCKCCAMSESYIADSVARLRERYGERLEVVERRCLDVCKEHGAVKVEGEIMVLKPTDIPTFEEKVHQAAGKVQA